MFKVSIALFCFNVLLMGCSRDDKYNYYANPPRQGAIDKSYEVRNIFKDAKIDILFVIDNSGSMGSIQNNIVKNSALFMKNFLIDNDMKWKMGIISTDKNDIPYLGFNTSFDNSYAATKTSDEVVQTFQSAVNRLGVMGDADEYVFYNTHRVMTDIMTRAFFRSDAHLAVIMVTDEEEQSEDEFGGQYEALSFLNMIRALKPEGKIIRFYGAFRFDDLQSCDRSYANYAKSPFENVIIATQGIHMSACTNDFGKNLAAIGKDILSIIDSPRMLLTERPVVESIRVYYDGVLLKPGKKEEGGFWFYSERYNTINFYSLDFMPNREDSKIKITYDIEDGVDREESKSFDSIH